MRRCGRLAFSLWLLAGIGQAQERDDRVFTVVGHDCLGRDLVRSGFRAIVDGEVGIVTTLHGVVGCRAVFAEDGGERVSGLEIASVDVSRDVAFLSRETPSTARFLRAGVGPPSIGGSRTVPIAALVPADELAVLGDRRSPRPEVAVFGPTRTSNPRDFGAPVLDAAGAVVGVENGVAGAFGPIGWVIPWQDIEWSPPVQNETEVDRLASQRSPLW